MTKLLTVPEVSSLLRLHRSTIYRKIAAGILPAVQTGQLHTAVRVDEGELRAWLYGGEEHAEWTFDLPALPTIPTWVEGTALEQLPFSWQLPEGVEYAPASWAGDLDDYDADR